MDAESLDIDRIERRQQAWEDRPATTYGDVARQLNQQTNDIAALIAEIRRLRGDEPPAPWFGREDTAGSRPPAMWFEHPEPIPPIEPYAERGWSGWGWVRRLLRIT